MISALVLAAGLAQRFGSAKTLALYHGKPLVRHVVDCLTLPGIHEIIVVTPRMAEYAAVLPSGVRIAVNERGSDGMSRSLLIGLDAIDPRTEAILVALADQPTIEREVVLALVREWRATRAHIVAPLYKGERGHPVLFDAAVFSELRTLAGDRGGRVVVDRDPRRVRLVDVDREAPQDVDTPDDLASLADSSEDRKRHI